MEAISGKHSQSRRRHRAASPTPLEQSDDGSSSPHRRMKDRHDHSRRKSEKFIYVQDLDKLVQKKRAEDVSMSRHGTQSHHPDASNSPFSEGILEYEFPKNLMILTLDCYSSQSDSV